MDTEARGKKPILAFVQNGVTHEEKQAALVADVQAWDSGLFRSGFDDANDLQGQIIRAIHEHQLAHAVAPLDVALLEQKSKQLLAQQSRRESSGTPFLKLAMVSGPIQQILRPAKLESAALKETLHQHALFGENRLFNPATGVNYGIDDAALFLEQKGGSRIQLDEQGALLFRQPVDQSKSRERSGFMLAIIEETVLDQLNRVIGYACWVLDQIDSTQRLAHVGIATAVDGSDYLSWRTQAEQDASPNAGRIHMDTGDARIPMTKGWFQYENIENESLSSAFEKNIGRFTVNLDPPIVSKVFGEAREEARERSRRGITKDDLVGYVSIEDWER